VYNSTIDYMQFLRFIRKIYNKNKILRVSNEKQLISIRKKHPHHVILGAFKTLHSRQLYNEFEKVANRLNTLKFIDFTDLEYFERTFEKEVFNRLNGSVVIIRKDEFVRRQIKQFEVYDPKNH
jgi:hypothetical protein